MLSVFDPLVTTSGRKDEVGHWLELALPGSMTINFPPKIMVTVDNRGEKNDA